MEELLTALAVVFLLVMGFKAFRGYGAYRKSVLRYLFGSYLEYFWNVSFREDLSRSAFLSDQIGYHRLAFNAYRNASTQQMIPFTTVFTLHGPVCLAEVHGDGVIEVAESGVWHRTTENGERVVFPSPIPALRQQISFMRSIIGALDTSFVLVFDNDARIDGVTCEHLCIQARDVLRVLEGESANVSELAIDEAFEAFKNAARDAAGR